MSREARKKHSVFSRYWTNKSSTFGRLPVRTVAIYELDDWDFATIDELRRQFAMSTCATLMYRWTVSQTFNWINVYRKRRIIDIFIHHQDGSKVDIRRLNKIHDLTKKQRMKQSSPNAYAMRYTNRLAWEENTSIAGNVTKYSNLHTQESFDKKIFTLSNFSFKKSVRWTKVTLGRLKRITVVQTLEC